MKKKLKKLLSVVLVLVMLVSAIPMSGATLLAGAAASSGQCGENVYWTLDNEGTLTINGEGEMWEDLMESPFFGNKNIKSVIIKDGVTTIGDSAFWCCINLKSVVISDSVTVIGSSAFYGCVSLESVEIGNGVRYIADCAFSDCTRLTAITIPDSVTHIGCEAFYGCQKLASVTMGNSVSFIESDVFVDTALYNNKSNWENGVLYIDKYLIAADSSKVSGNYTIKNGTQVIASDAFFWCDRLASVNIPNSVICIGDSAFDSCSKLTSVTIPNSVTHIGYSAFEDCVRLANVTMGNSVTSIGEYAFYNTALYNNKSNWENNVLYIGKYLVSADSISGNYTIKNGTELIADGAFSWCDDLVSVSIPNGVKIIGEYAFKYCDSLANVTISDSVTTIGERAFDNCPNLKNVVIPDSVITIGDCAFGYYYYYFNGFYHRFQFRVEDFKIYGHTGTEAERYANENEVDFILFTNQHIHYYTSEIIVPATCTEEGVRSYTCECGDSYTGTISAKEHTDMNDDGVCDNCGEILWQVMPGFSFIQRLKNFFQRIIEWIRKLFRR